MASLANSVYNNIDTSFTGLWEDVQKYNSAVITLRSGTDGSGTILWANTLRAQFPSESDVITTERFIYTASGPITIEVPHRARWYKLQFTHNGTPNNNDVSFNLQTLHKKAASNIAITGSNAEVVSLIEHSYSVNLSNSMMPSALYTTLANTDSSVMRYTDNLQDNKSLVVVPVDSCGNNLTNLYGATFVCPTDACGHVQASTTDVSGAKTSGSALYITGADTCGAWTTVNTAKTIADALAVTLADSSSNTVGTLSKPIYVKTEVNAGGIRSFDISHGITETIVLLQGGKNTLYNIFTYNDGPVVLWTKFYDFSNDDIPLIIPAEMAEESYFIFRYSDAVQYTYTYTYTITLLKKDITLKGIPKKLSEYGHKIEMSLINSLYLKITNNNQLDMEIEKTYLFSQLGFDFKQDEVKLTLPGTDGVTGNNFIVAKRPLSYNILNDYVKLNIATPPHQCRDMSFPKGIQFDNNIYVRTSQGQAYNDILTPGKDVLFLSGSYL